MAVLYFMKDSFYFLSNMFHSTFQKCNIISEDVSKTDSKQLFHKLNKT
jgi:hypothetical protein